MARDNSADSTPWAIICPNFRQLLLESGVPDREGLGLVFLTEEQYLSQLRSPDDSWKCPGCGSDAQWDDYCQSTNPSEEG